MLIAYHRMYNPAVNHPMSANNTPEGNAQARYLLARAAFVGRGTTLKAWSRDNGARIQNVRDAFFGKWQGKKATALVEKVMSASGATK